MRLDGTVCLLTGASEGIGRATAEALAERGASVVLVARSAEALHQLQRELAAFPGERLVVPTDLSSPTTRQQVIERTLAHFGRVDVLINNAGLGLDAPVESHSIDETRYLFEVNFFAPFHLIQMLLPVMRQQERSQIIQVSSMVGLRAVPNNGVYSASKYALNGLSDALRAELQGSNVTVTSIYPGVTATNFSRNQLRTPRIRPRRGAASPEQVAALIIKAIEQRPRALYVTRRDRLFVTAAMAFPGLAEWALGHLFRRRRRLG